MYTNAPLLGNVRGRVPQPPKFVPILIEGRPNCPSWAFFAPVDAEYGSLRNLVSDTIVRYTDAVFAAFRYAVYNANVDAADGNANRPVECDEPQQVPLGPDFPGIGRHFGAPTVIAKMREDGWRVPETFRTCFHTEHLTCELRGYSLSGAKPGGRLAARIHIELTSMSPSRANQLVWPTEHSLH